MKESDTILLWMMSETLHWRFCEKKVDGIRANRERSCVRIWIFAGDGRTALNGSIGETVTEMDYVPI